MRAVKNPDPSGKQEAVIVQSRARLRVGLVCLVAIVLLGMTLGIFQEPQPVSQPSDVVNVHGSGNSTDSASAVISQGPAMPKQSRGALPIEVCGLGHFGAETDLESVRKVHADAIHAAKEANIESLLAAAEPTTRAAGLVMRMAETAQRGVMERMATAETCATTGKKPSEADKPEACVVPLQDGDAIVAQVRQGFAPWAEKLAAVAATSSDPRVFAQAVRACEGQPTIQACNAVTAERWARLEPGNLVPWIRILNNARARQDTAGVNEALHQMSVAQYASTYELFAWTKLAAQADAGTNLQRLGSTEQMASVHLLPSLEIGGLFAECKKPSIADANRRQLCDRIATVLSKQSDSYALATFGRGDWSARWMVQPQARGDSGREIGRSTSARGINECSIRSGGCSKIGLSIGRASSKLLQFLRPMGRTGSWA